MKQVGQLLLLSLLLVAAVLGAEQSASPVNYYVQLIWGTNRDKPPEANFKTVGPKLGSELSRVFQWQRYWEVNRQRVTVAQQKPAKVRLSPECEVQIEFVSPGVRETRIYGKGILVSKTRRKIDCHNLAINGGTIETGGSWFVVVREDEPKEN